MRRAQRSLTSVALLATLATDGVLTVTTGAMQRVWSLPQWETLRVFDHRRLRTVATASTDVSIWIVGEASAALDTLAGGQRLLTPGTVLGEVRSGIA